MAQKDSFPLLIPGARITLRDFTSDDCDSVLEYVSDPHVTRYLDWGPSTRMQTEEFLARVIHLARTAVVREEFELGIVENATNRLVGGARLTVRSSVHRVADIGYVLRKDRWGLGYGTEVAQMLIEFGFKSLGLHRIEATCDPENRGSRRILEKSHMELEGRRRERLWIRDHWRDSLLFALLEPYDQR